MTGAALWVALLLASDAGHERNAGELPWCGVRVVNEVVARAGCALGDVRCWNRAGGYCTDYVEQQLLARSTAPRIELEPVAPDEVRAGDVAVFASRAHYAIVEKVVRGRDGRPDTIEVTERNFGTCWVDKDSLITDHFKVTGRRKGLPLSAADGGYLRARPLAR